MHAITIRQPMAWAIRHEGKRIENRTGITRWRGLTGETVAVHAGKTWEPSYAEDILDTLGYAPVPDWPDVLYGAIIATARITDVHWSDGECCDPWGQHGTGISHLVLDLVRPCTPVYCRGALGAWRVPDAMAREVGQRCRS